VHWARLEASALGSLIAACPAWKRREETPKVKIFETVFPDSAMGHRTTFHDQIRWKSAVANLPKGRVVNQTKKTRPSPILAKMGRLCPKFPERCHLLTYPRIPNLVQIGCVLPDLFRKDWFFGPKSQYNIGFQPTINLYRHQGKTIFCVRPENI